MTQHFNLLDTGRVEKKCAFDPNPVGDTAYREVAIDATTTQAHHYALKRLQAFAGSFNDSDLQAHSIA
jgi:hypothetical protein